MDARLVRSSRYKSETIEVGAQHSNKIRLGTRLTTLSDEVDKEIDFGDDVGSSKVVRGGNNKRLESTKVRVGDNLSGPTLHAVPTFWLDSSMRVTMRVEHMANMEARR